MRYILIIPIRVYRVFISPILATYFGRACRYDPTCSEYSRQAILKYGTKGVILSLRRILRCNNRATKYYDPLL